jgi:hypothetical protein
LGDSDALEKARIVLQAVVKRVIFVGKGDQHTSRLSETAYDDFLLLRQAKEKAGVPTIWRASAEAERNARHRATEPLPLSFRPHRSYAPPATAARLVGETHAPLEPPRAVDRPGRRRRSHYTATVYPGPRGNHVFNASTIFWAQGLAAPPGHIPPIAHRGRPHGPDPRVQRITRNVFERFRG